MLQSIAESWGILVADFLDAEDAVFEGLFVETQFASLSETLCASWVVTHKRLLIVVDVHVFLQVLAQSKFFVALGALELAVRLMGGHVAPQ